MTRPAIAVVCGPTASGKTALALDLARSLGGEIINADSVQVYRGADIGSAKPSSAERAEVAHHLVDRLPPTARWSAADFAVAADEAIADVAQRGRLPVVCGGGGLYLRSLLHGLAAAAPASPEVRVALHAELEHHGVGALHDRLVEIDPDAASAIAPRDAVRIVRALEIVQLTGRRASEWRAEHGLREERYPGAAVLVLTGPRAWLHQRIEARSRAMVDAGLLAETRALIDAGAQRDGAVLGAIGYRESVACLDGALAPGALAGAIAASTRAYARRQLVWFRRQLRGARFVDASRPTLPDEAVAAFAAWRGGGGFSLGFATEAEAGKSD